MAGNSQPAQGDTAGGAWYHAVICAACALILLVVFYNPSAIPEGFKAEHSAADWRTAYLSDRYSSSYENIVIVAITEQSVEQFRYFLPINRGHLAAIIDAAFDADAKAIGLDFFFTRDTETELDDRLKTSIRRAKDRVVVGIFEDDRNRAQLSYQYDFIRNTGARAGYIDLVPDSDRVVRYRPSAQQGVRFTKSFSTVLAGTLRPVPQPLPERIAWLLPPKNGRPTFTKVASHELLTLSPEEKRALLKDRIVLVGGELYSLDRHYTPLSVRTDDKMVGVEIHAYMVSELVDGNRSYTEPTPIQTRLLVGVLALVAFASGAQFHGRKWDFLDWKFASILVILADLALFKFLHVVLPFTVIAVAWIAAVTGGTQLRPALGWVRSRWKVWQGVVSQK